MSGLSSEALMAGSFPTPVSRHAMRNSSIACGTRRPNAWKHSINVRLKAGKSDLQDCLLKPEPGF